MCPYFMADERQNPPRRIAPLTTKSTSWPSQAAQAPSPIGNGRVGTISGDLIRHVGLGAMPAAFAPYEQPDLGRERLAQRHRCRLTSDIRHD